MDQRHEERARESGLHGPAPQRHEGSDQDAQHMQRTGPAWSHWQRCCDQEERGGTRAREWQGGPESNVRIFGERVYNLGGHTHKASGRDHVSTGWREVCHCRMRRPLLQSPLSHPLRGSSQVYTVRENAMLSTAKRARACGP